MINDLSACKNQVFRFFRYLDERDYQSLIDLLVADAVWHRQGKILVGPAQIHDALTQRSPTMRIAHLITNLMADTVQNGDCTMRAYMVVFRHEPGREIAGPSPIEGVDSIRTMHIKLRHQNEQWLISEMRGDDVLFAFQAREEEKK